MKKGFFFLIFLSLSGTGFSQSINFDDSVNLFRIRIDTTISDNIWKIGQPQKNVFTSAHSLPNAIVTDLHLPYPNNNNSIFYLGTGGDNGKLIHVTELIFWYRMDTDTLNDYGKIDISTDNGQSWHNLLTDGRYQVLDTMGNQIITSGTIDTSVFSGITNGWYRFHAQLLLSDTTFYDTIVYRFTFHSDNVFNNGDGWIIDDIQFGYGWESISDQTSSYNLYPNPANYEIHINSKSLINNIGIYNVMGILVNTINMKGTSMTVNIANLGTGMYFYSINYENGKKDTGKFIKHF